MTDVTVLVSNLKATVLVLKDELSRPANPDTFRMVSGMMEEVRALRASLGKRASDLAESNNAEHTETIFAALEASSDLEADFKNWSRAMDTENQSIPQISNLSKLSSASKPSTPPPPPPARRQSSSFSAEPQFDIPKINSEIEIEGSKKLKKKKSKITADLVDFGIEWDAFAAPPDIPSSTASLPMAPPAPPTLPATTSQGPAATVSAGWPLRGRVRIFLPWADVGPLLCENPQAGEEARRARLETFLAQSLAKSCGFAERRITATVRSTQ